VSSQRKGRHAIFSVALLGIGGFAKIKSDVRARSGTRESSFAPNVRRIGYVTAQLSAFMWFLICGEAIPASVQAVPYLCIKISNI